MFEDEYIAVIIKPKIDMILVDGVESIGQLVARFNKAYKCKVSKNRMARWLKAMNYRVTRKVEITSPTVRKAKVEPARPSNPEPTSEFMTQHRQQFFNYPPPTSVFSNVQMPGFQE